LFVAKRRQSNLVTKSWACFWVRMNSISCMKSPNGTKKEVNGRYHSLLLIRKLKTCSSQLLMLSNGLNNIRMKEIWSSTKAPWKTMKSLSMLESQVTSTDSSLTRRGMSCPLNVKVMVETIVMIITQSAKKHTKFYLMVVTLLRLERISIMVINQFRTRRVRIRMKLFRREGESTSVKILIPWWILTPNNKWPRKTFI